MNGDSLTCYTYFPRLAYSDVLRLWSTAVALFQRLAPQRLNLIHEYVCHINRFFALLDSHSMRFTVFINA